MKVAMVTPRFIKDIRGGGEISCKLLVDTLRTLGVEVDVFSGDELYPEIKSKEALNIAMYRFLKPFKDEFDIFHTYNMSLLPAIGKLTKKYNINSVASLNGHVYSPYFCQELSDHPKREYPVLKIIFDRYIKHIKKFTALSDWYKNVWVKDGIPKEQIQVIPNMIVKDCSTDRDLISYNKTVDILVVGNYAKWRNLKMILDAYSKLPKQNILLTVVGQGWEKETANYKGKNTLIYYSYAKPNILKNLYTFADIYVQAYNHHGMGRTMLEAAQSKTAILTTGRPKDFSYLHNDMSYFDNAAELEWKLQTLIADKKLRDEMSKNVSEIAEKYFNPKFVTKQYIKLYKEMKNVKHTTI